MPSVLQDWVQDLPFMQQSVLISAIRGPDGLHKEHIAKYVLRWLRRCVLISAFDKKVIDSPTAPGGGSFTGPIKPLSLKCSAELFEQNPRRDDIVLEQVFEEYMRCVDEVPHHFHLHLMHAAGILGYKHPNDWAAKGWRAFYFALAHDMHLYPEDPKEMADRLGDTEAGWRAREAVPAKDEPRIARDCDTCGKSMKLPAGSNQTECSRCSDGGAS